MRVEIDGREVHPLVGALMAVAGVLIALGAVAVVFLVVLPSVFVVVAVVLVVLAIVLPVAILAGAVARLARPGVRGSGVEGSERRSVEPFHAVSLPGALTVTVVCGEEESVTVTGDDNLLEHVRTSVRDGVLHVATDRPVRPRVGLTIDVAAKALDAVTASGACTVTVAGIDADRFTLKDSGAGRAHLAGRCREAAMHLSGACRLDADELVCEAVEIHLSGASNATVRATERLTVRASGASKLTCHGQPSHVDQQASGASKIEVA